MEMDESTLTPEEVAFRDKTFNAFLETDAGKSVVSLLNANSEAYVCTKFMRSLPFSGRDTTIAATCLVAMSLCANNMVSKAIATGENGVKEDRYDLLTPEERLQIEDILRQALDSLPKC